MWRKYYIFSNIRWKWKWLVWKEQRPQKIDWTSFTINATDCIASHWNVRNRGEWFILLSFKYTLLCCLCCAYRHMKQLYYACVQWVFLLYTFIIIFSHRNGNEFTFIYFRHSKIINCNRMGWWMFYLIGQQTMHENIALSMAIVFVWVCGFDFFFLQIHGIYI